MPVYEYKCCKCGVIFSTFQKIGASEGDTECPECSSNTVKKVFSAFSCSSSGNSSSAPASTRRGYGGG